MGIVSGVSVPCCCILIVFLVRGSFSAVPADEVTALPGLSKTPSFKQYSGYLKATGRKLLHYWFVESQRDPKKDAVVLWLNGGPGCSSLDGFLTEHGPFLAQSDGSLKENPYSWNKFANMLYLEAPAGVGFSYSPDMDYGTDDDLVAKDNYQALKYFFTMYPEFKTNEFFITGESYGGIYVPTLSVLIADSGNFNFKGFAVGNGMSNYRMNTDSLVYFGYYHGLWGNSLWTSLVKDCCKDANDDPESCDFTGGQSAKCQYDLSQASAVIGRLNIYNMYANCYYDHKDSAKRDNMTYIYTSQLLLSHVPWLYTDFKENLGKVAKAENLKLVPPCVNATAIHDYLNTDSVRKAIHVSDSVHEWEICSAAVGMKYQRKYDNMTAQYKHILNSDKFRVLVYNGDIDMACNFLMDEWFTTSLQQKLVEASKSWSYKAEDGSQQIGGYITQYENMWFTTVKGAGHMVPTDQPIPALDMFKAFLDNSAMT